MKLTNTQIKVIINSIVSLPLDVKQASARRRIFRSLNEYSEDVEAVRMELINKYAEKEHDKVKIDPKGYPLFTRDNAVKFRKDMNKILDEEIEIKIDVTNKKDWDTTKEILKDEIKKNTKEKMTAEQFDLVESLQEIVELIK